MKVFFLRLFFILSLVFFEFSFLDILFPQLAVPCALIVSVVAWALIVDFPQVLYRVIPLAAFFDIASSGNLGALTLYAVLLAYATSFLSRRLLVEHRGMGMVLYALFAAAGSFGYVVFHFLFFQGSPLAWTAGTLEHFFSIVASLELFWLIALSVLLFPVMYWLIRRFETSMSFAAQRETLQMR